MKFYFVSFIFLIISMTTFAASDFTPSYDPEIKIVKINEKITIDGLLNEPVWEKAARADNFSETDPGDQTKPSVESVALLAYDENNLYVALIAYDDPATVRVSLRDRDKIFQDDYFGIMLDTYGDFSWGYEIFVNPLGIQGDLRIVSSGDEDISFDLVFESRGIVTDSGYQVELAIPFSSLRFPDKSKQTWRINFWRDHQRDVRRRYSWAAQDRNDPCTICQWGRVTGIENIKPSSNLDILPNIIAYQSGSRDNPFDHFEQTDPDAEGSFNLRYGLTTNSSIEFSYNPDFSQVESDADQVDVNITFGLYYPERRPFFQEGSDLFDTEINAVYTRSINDPQVAVKFTGQFNRTSIAYLFARDENSPLVIPLEEQSIQTLIGKSISNIVRVRQAILRNSYVGLMFTDRRQSDFVHESINNIGGSGTVYGIDGRIEIKNNLGFEWQVLGSHIKEAYAPDLINISEDADGQILFNRDRNTVALDNESYNGHAVFSSISYNTSVYYFVTDYRETSPTFRTDNGFTNQAGRRELFMLHNFTYRPNGKFLTAWGPGAHLGRVWNFDGKFRDEWISSWILLKFVSQTDVKFEYINSRERFKDILFEGISEGTIRVDNRTFDKINGGFTIRYGNRIYRGTPAEMAKNRDYSVYLNFKPTKQLYIEPNFRHVRMDDRYDGSNIFKGYILRSRFNYQFTREWFIRLVVQYNDFDKQVDFEPLLTYKINPFTVFYVGAVNRSQEFDIYDNNDMFVESIWKTSSRQFFVKFQYLFRI